MKNQPTRRSCLTKVMGGLLACFVAGGGGLNAGAPAGKPEESGRGEVFQASGLPAGLCINATTGAASGTDAAKPGADGRHRVTMVVSDGTYSDEASFDWHVNTPPR